MPYVYLNQKPKFPPRPEAIYSVADQYKPFSPTERLSSPSLSSPGTSFHHQSLPTLSPLSPTSPSARLKRSASVPPQDAAQRWPVSSDGGHGTVPTSPDRAEPGVRTMRRLCRRAGIETSICDTPRTLQGRLAHEGPPALLDELRRSQPLKWDALAADAQPTLHGRPTTAPPTRGGGLLSAQDLSLSRVIAASELLADTLASEAARTAGAGSPEGSSGSSGEHAGFRVALQAHIDSLRAMVSSCAFAQREAETRSREIEARRRATLDAERAIRQEKARLERSLREAEASHAASSDSDGHRRKADADALAGALADLDVTRSDLNRTSGECRALRARLHATLQSEQTARQAVDASRSEVLQLRVIVKMLRRQVESKAVDGLRQGLIDEQALRKSLQSEKRRIEAQLEATDQALKEANATCEAHAARIASRVVGGRLVTIDQIRARHVPDRDGATRDLNDKDVSDPYAKVELLDLGGKALMQRKTSVIRNSTDPVWPDALVLYLPITGAPWPPVVKVTKPPLVYSPALVLHARTLSSSCCRSSYRRRRWPPST